MEFILPRASTLQSCPFLSGSLDLQNHTWVKFSSGLLCFGLLSFCVPDRAGCVIIQGLSKDEMIYALFIDVHFVVITKRKAEAISEDIAVTAHVRGQVNFAAPG